MIEFEVYVKNRLLIGFLFLLVQIFNADLTALAENDDWLCDVRDDLETVLPLFSDNSVYPDLLRICVTEDADQQDEALTALSRVFYQQRNEDQLTPQDVAALLEVAVTVDFPEPGWESPGECIVGMLMEMKPAQIQPIIERVKEVYQPDNEFLASRFLILLASSESVEGAEALVKCVSYSGWPKQISPRVFLTLERMPDEAMKILFPELLFCEQNEKIVASLADVLLKTDPTVISLEQLAPLRPRVLDKLTNYVGCTSQLSDDADEWYSEDFENVWKLVPYLKIAGCVNDPQTYELLNEARKLKTVMVLRHSLVASIQCGLEVSEEDLRSVAADYDSVVYLFESLERIDRLELFPVEFRKWEQFALAGAMPDIVHELLAPPQAANLVERIEEAGPDGQLWTALLWKVRLSPEDPWMTCMTGPHQFVGEPRPLPPVPVALSQYIPWEWKDSEREANIEKLREALIERLNRRPRRLP